MIRPLLMIFLATALIATAQETIPDGFVMQVLEPTGGKILRPKDWFYTESHNGPSYTWILSKEDPRKSRYDTGVRIQTLIGVEKGTGKSPKTFVLDFLSQKEKEVQRIYKTCDARDQGLFTRVCLEADEGDYRILYSLFWGNNIDVVVVSIAGAKKADWSKYSDVFDLMSSFELIDMTRFETNNSEQGVPPYGAQGAPSGER